MAVRRSARRPARRKFAGLPQSRDPLSELAMLLEEAGASAAEISEWVADPSLDDDAIRLILATPISQIRHALVLAREGGLRD